MSKPTRCYNAPPMMRLEDFDTVLRSRGRTDSTTKAYLRWCDEFGKWLTTTRGSQVSPTEELAKAFLSECEVHRELRPATLNNVRQALAAWSRVFQAPGWFRRQESAPATLPPNLHHFQKWLRKGAKAERTVTAYIQRVRLFEAWYEAELGIPFDLTAWVSSDVMAYREFLLDRGNNGLPMKPSTINLAMSALSMYGIWAAKSGLIDQSPVPDPGNLMVSGEFNDAPRWLTSSEDERLYQVLAVRTQIKGETPGALMLAARDLALYLVMRDAGLRAGEVCGLRQHDVTLSDQRISVQYGKWNRTRRIAMTNRLAAALQAWQSARSSVASEYLFLSERNEQLTPHAIQHRAAKWREWADLPSWFTPHTLRHTFAHGLTHNGVDLVQVATLLGLMRRDGTPNLDMVAIYKRPS